MIRTAAATRSRNPAENTCSRSQERARSARSRDVVAPDPARLPPEGSCHRSADRARTEQAQASRCGDTPTCAGQPIVDGFMRARLRTHDNGRTRPTATRHRPDLVATSASRSRGSAELTRSRPQQRVRSSGSPDLANETPTFNGRASVAEKAQTEQNATRDRAISPRQHARARSNVCARQDHVILRTRRRSPIGERPSPP